MTNQIPDPRHEVERIRRVSDQLCTGHAILRDRYIRLAFVLDIGLLVLSAWVTTAALIDPKLYPWVIPPGWDATLLIGLLGFIAFCGGLFQFKADWKGRSEAHRRTHVMYAEVKREANYILATSEAIEPREFQRFAARYDMASDSGVPIPDGKFLSMKRRHLQKVAISKLLDTRPGLSVTLTKAKMYICDNLPWRKS